MKFLYNTIFALLLQCGEAAIIPHSRSYLRRGVAISMPNNLQVSKFPGSGRRHFRGPSAMLRNAGQQANNDVDENIVSDSTQSKSCDSSSSPNDYNLNAKFVMRSQQRRAINDTEISLANAQLSNAIGRCNTSNKNQSQQYALAQCFIHFPRTSKLVDLLQLQQIESANIESGIQLPLKGDVFTASQLSGILGAKNTALILPLCHPGLQLDCVDIKMDFMDNDNNMTLNANSMSGSDSDLFIDHISEKDSEYVRIRIRCSVTMMDGKSSLEMEALTGCSTAALNFYDMCKNVEKNIRIDGLQLIERNEIV